MTPSMKAASLLGLVYLLSSGIQARIQVPIWDTTTASNADLRHQKCGTSLETQSATTSNARCAGDCPGNAVCPGGNGQVRITPSGRLFKLYCGTQHGQGIISQEYKSSFSECVDACAETAGCFGVDYFDSKGECHYLGQTQTESHTNSQADSAVRVDLSVAQPLACPEAEGKIIVSTSRVYRVACGLWSPNSIFLSNNTINTFEQCTDLCDSTISCAFADYKPGACYLKGSWDVPANGKRTSPDCAWFEPIAWV